MPLLAIFTLIFVALAGSSAANPLRCAIKATRDYGRSAMIVGLAEGVSTGTRGRYAMRVDVSHHTNMSVSSQGGRFSVASRHSDGNVVLSEMVVSAVVGTSIHAQLRVSVGRVTANCESTFRY